MPFSLSALKTELDTDPLGLGYAQAASDVAVADLLNLPRAAIRIRRADVASAEIAAAIAVADYAALSGNPTAAQLSTERRFLAWLTAILAVPSLRLANDDGSNGPVITNFQAMFGAGTGTRTRLMALAERDGSRAEQLFGAGVAVSYTSVGQAKQGA
jgi:hypothetical protein